MSDDDRRKWDARWSERRAAEPGAGEPSALVTELDPLLPRRGRALDLAGGAGRHAIWLARRGLDVLLADVSPVGLAIAADAAASSGVTLATLAIDLEQAPPPTGPFDLVLVFHYLDRELYRRLPATLAPGGLLVVVHPTRKNLERHPKPSARFLLEEGELPALVQGLETVRYEEGWLGEGRHEARLVARRPW